MLWAGAMGFVIIAVLRSLDVGMDSCPRTVRHRSSGCRGPCGSWLTGLALMLLFMRHVRAREAAGAEPLVSPGLFANRQMTGGLLMFFFQFVVMMGLFFAIPSTCPWRSGSRRSTRG